MQRFAIAVLSEHNVEAAAIAFAAGVSIDTVHRWQQRQDEGLDIFDAPRPGRPRLYDKDVEDRFIGFFCQSTPLSGHGRWSLRWAEAELTRANAPKSSDEERDPRPGDIVGVPLKRSTMHRMLVRNKLKPHRNRYFLHITDPDFFPKMEHIIAVYKAPPKHLFCFDECPGIQIRQRITPDLRPTDMDNINTWWKEFEYIRNGTTDLFAFLNVKTGELSLSCHPDHKKDTFIDRFRAHVKSLDLPAEERIDYIMDNLDSHRSYDFCLLVAELSDVTCPPPSALPSQELRQRWLQKTDKRIVIHFTPFHGSWLNMVEICFAGIAQHCLQDQYDGPEALHGAIMDYGNYWNENLAHPFHWQYDGKGLHQKAVQRFTALLGSPDKMTLQFLTKSCKLMVNLLRNYTHEVKQAVWQKLTEAAINHESRLRQLINASEQPIVKKNAQSALDDFLQKVKPLQPASTADKELPVKAA